VRISKPADVELPSWLQAPVPKKPA